MRKVEVLSLSLLSIIILSAIAFMDYFFPGLDPDSRRRNIEVILVLAAIILLMIVPKFIPDQEDTKEAPFLIELFSLGLAFFMYNTIESSLGGLMAYPFFTKAGVFDARSPLSFLVYVFLFWGTAIIIKKIYFFLTDRREQKIKSRRKWTE